MRRIKEGTSAVLLQSGLNENWWADSMECDTYLRNVTDLSSDGKTPYERRFGSTKKRTNNPIWCNGRISPYFCQRPVATSSVRQESLTRKILRLCIVRGGESEKGTYVLVTDIEELEKMDASEIHAKTLKAKEAFTPQKNVKHLFLVADETVKLSGGDQVVKTSTLIQDSPDRREEQGNLSGESDGSSPTPFQDSSLCDGEARNDFWSISGNCICRHHVERKVKLYVPREASCPILLKYIDVTKDERVQGQLLRDYEQKFANLPNAGLANTVEKGQYVTTLDDEELDRLKGSCREYTLSRSDKSSQVKGWIRGNTKIGVVPDIAVSYHQGRNGVEIMITLHLAMELAHG